ncbi:hypothetical protein BYT27DRAFT_7248382 [Phlegmacium glaucopus]|nr:hypothetical protein BYT27DRAFT_7248382 [Phlegmacium glaucopus]
MPAISSESNFSAPWMRATLINMCNYVASPDFDLEVVWMKTGNQNNLMNAPLDNKHTPSEKATCTVVSVISSDRLFIDAHGNFNPSFPNSTLETAKAQFQIVSPETHPEFKTDFQTSLEHIKNLQRKAATDGPGPEHFIVWDTSKREKVIKFSWPLFEKRTIQYDSTDDEDWSNGYPIGDRFQTMFKNIIHKWQVDPMRVYDAQGKLIKTHNLELSLKGSLILIQFSLRHYAIREKNNNGKASNTFSAMATEIQILEPAKKCTPSPYKILALKGPTFLPQSPSMRRDQISAANSFHPGNDKRRQYLLQNSFLYKQHSLLV